MPSTGGRESHSGRAKTGYQFELGSRQPLAIGLSRLIRLELGNDHSTPARAPAMR